METPIDTAHKENFESFCSTEEDFMNKVMDTLRNSYSKSDFGIDQLAEELRFSRMQLHRKVKALTSKSPGEVLRTIRMNKAMEILLYASNEYTIKEIGLQVGFVNCNSFTRAFKDYTGYTPSEFLDRNFAHANMLW